ncbi:hypothetical protein ACFWNG_33310 [Streptomyces sp. NPDC058391]|uniref:hypothetical protein n=1 Tax=Streptomyces sp. NPDC058391 TaxID=3346476 RepID=UPI00365F3E47
MATRPSDEWRARVAEEARELATGVMDLECAYMAQLFPESLLEATDTALQTFEADVRALRNPSDEQVFETIKHVVLALNEINEEHDGAGYETDEREQLCAYIDQALSERGIDIPALTERNGIGRFEITDEWRDW